MSGAADDVRMRLGERFARKLAVSRAAASVPMVDFEVIGEAPDGTQHLVDDVVAVLRERGYRVARIERDGDASFDELLARVGEPYDVAVCTSFGYQPIPKIVISRRMQEAMNLCLPAMIGYVSDEDDPQCMFRWFDPGDVAGLADFIEASVIRRSVVTPTSAAVPYFGARVRWRCGRVSRLLCRARATFSGT